MINSLLDIKCTSQNFGNACNASLNSCNDHTFYVISCGINTHVVAWMTPDARNHATTLDNIDYLLLSQFSIICDDSYKGKKFKLKEGASIVD